MTPDERDETTPQPKGGAETPDPREGQPAEDSRGQDEVRRDLGPGDGDDPPPDGDDEPLTSLPASGGNRP